MSLESRLHRGVAICSGKQSQEKYVVSKASSIIQCEQSWSLYWKHRNTMYFPQSSWMVSLFYLKYDDEQDKHFICFASACWRWHADVTI